MTRGKKKKEDDDHSMCIGTRRGKKKKGQKHLWHIPKNTCLYVESFLCMHTTGTDFFLDFFRSLHFFLWFVWGRREAVRQCPARLSGTTVPFNDRPF